MEGGWYILSGVLLLGFGYTMAGVYVYVFAFAFDLALSLDAIGCCCNFLFFLLEDVFALVDLLYFAVLALSNLPWHIA